MPKPQGRFLSIPRPEEHIGMIPIGDDNSDLRHRRVIMPLLVLACLGVWFWQLGDFEPRTHAWAAVPWELSHGQNLGHEIIVVDGRQIPLVHPPLPQPWMLWLTPFSAMFLHGSWLHLCFNLLFLWIFGDQIEDRLGRLRFLAFYLSCGLIACLAHVLRDPGSHLPMIGASGAIAGVLGAYLRCSPWNRVTVLIGIFPLPLPAVIVLIGWFVLQWLGLRDPGTNVAYMAHIGGFLAGLLLYGRFKPAAAHSKT
jgi:membrane associated rhomboid family serine protease